MNIQILRQIQVRIEKDSIIPILYPVVMIREKEDFYTKRLVIEIGIIKNRQLLWFKEDEIIEWNNRMDLFMKE